MGIAKCKTGALWLPVIVVFGVALTLLVNWYRSHLQKEQIYAKWRNAGALAFFNEHGGVRILVADMGPGQFHPSSLMEVTDSNDLEILALTGTSVTDQDLECLRNLPKLRSLGLENTHISDAGISYIGKLHTLETLVLSGTKVTDACIPDLLQLVNLKELVVQGSQISSGGVKRLRDALPNTEIK